LVSVNQLLDDDDVAGLKTLGALFNSELDLLAFLQILEAFALDRGEVHENIIAAFASEEAVALRSIEPLDCLLWQEKIWRVLNWVLHRSRLNGGKTKSPTDDP
jgi:hypothetical protein